MKKDTRSAEDAVFGSARSIRFVDVQLLSQFAEAKAAFSKHRFEIDRCHGA
jgi:hypothetical protein